MSDKYQSEYVNVLKYGKTNQAFFFSTYELDDLIKELGEPYFPKRFLNNYESSADLESYRGYSRVILVDKVVFGLDSIVLKDIESNNFATGCTRSILNFLCSEGKIPLGIYVISF